MKRVRGEGNLAWLDLEMTGLDPERDVILQAALIITTAELEPLEEWCGDIWQPEEALGRMTPFVRKMHETTGLTERVRRSELELRRAEQQLIERVHGWCGHPAVLAGNTIGSDRRFVDRWMPGLAGLLHYRMLDVTSVKLLASHWYGPEAVYVKPPAGQHDALVDIRNSIAELSHYRRTLFKAPPAGPTRP